MQVKPLQFEIFVAEIGEVNDHVPNCAAKFCKNANLW